jgi:hypothetical protein
MPDMAILQLHHGEPDIGTSAASYVEAVQQQGLPATHTQLLQELKAWTAAIPAFRQQPLVAMQRVLEAESNILLDAGVAGIAAEHMPFLYTVLGQVFAELGPAFRQALRHEAVQAEQAYEADMHKQMDDTGSDRLEALYDMESIALQRLQARQERVLLLLEGLEDEDMAQLSE